MAARDKTLLLIEDFITERALWKMLLEKHGYIVLEARDSIHALNILKKNKVDLVVLDLSIPPAGR
ncbi:MAG: response regulator, partial [Actinobacteria bacterium]|nr:response regulator [Actinomycetota bacterium]